MLWIYSKMINQSRPEKLARIHRWRKRMFCKRYCNKLSRNQSFSTNYQNPQLCWEWVRNCLLFFSSWLTIFCKGTYVIVFGVGVFVQKIPRCESWCFRPVSYSCFKTFWVIVLLIVEELPEFNIGSTGTVFFVENTTQVFFCMHCFLNTYTHHNEKWWNLSDELQFFHCSWSPEKLKKYITTDIG